MKKGCILSMMRYLMGLLAVVALRADTLVAFGSCLDTRNPLAVLEAISSSGANTFLFLGDNIYADTADPVRLRAEYDRLTGSPEFRKLWSTLPVYATWDDHDYGANDAGADFPGKATSRMEFLRAFPVADDQRLKRTEGVYSEVLLKSEGKAVQILLLDTRSFRSPLKKGRIRDGEGYIANNDPYVSMLGREQWRWLRLQLQKPADFRVIASSIQVLPDTHRFERWATFPGEKKRLLDLVAGSREPVVFVSGDRHIGEIIRTKSGHRYFTEVTSSSLNKPLDIIKLKGIEPNPDRIGNAVQEANWGSLRIDWKTRKATLQLISAPQGPVLAEVSLPFERLVPAQ